MAGSDPWEAILERIADGASLIGLDPDLLRMLCLPEKTLEVAVPIRRDSGDIEVFRGWRVHHNSARGPGKGGIRFHQSVTAHEVMALAADMTLKSRPQPTREHPEAHRSRWCRPTPSLWYTHSTTSLVWPQPKQYRMPSSRCSCKEGERSKWPWEASRATTSR